MHPSLAVLALGLGAIAQASEAIKWQDEYEARPLPARRDLDKFHYDVVRSETKPPNAIEAMAIPGHWVVELPRSLHKRQEMSRIQKRASVWANKDTSSLNEQALAGAQAEAQAEAQEAASPSSLGQDSGTCCVPPKLSRRAASNLQEVRDEFDIRDPLFGQQWHIFNAEQPGHDMNILEAWRKGFTGKDVTVAIVDDGLDYNHPDFSESFELGSSYDYNKHRQEPTPELYDDWHGTRCAGEIAAGHNDVCGVGVAPDAKVAGIRILSGALTSVDEARALNHMMHKNDIYSCSWGPADDGIHMEGPPDIVRRSILNGIENGREGRGSVYMQAAGNGFHRGDNCNYDGYTNSIYSITVSSVDINNEHPFYAESCSANFVTTYSSNSNIKITSTDPLSQHRGDESHACTDAHTGTSASAPMAAGIIALVLDARPELTWRDVQYVCRDAAVPFEMATTDRGNWTEVADGKLYHNDYGYGLLDAGRAVDAAVAHELVGPQTWFFSDVREHNKNFDTVFEDTVEITEEDVADFKRLEHANVRLSYQFQKRGALKFSLVSPSGLEVVLADARQNDITNAHVSDWTFNSVAHWGEQAVGNWTLRVENVAGEELPLGGQFNRWSLRLWGESKGTEKRLYSDMWDQENKALGEYEKGVLEAPATSTYELTAANGTSEASSAATSTDEPTSTEASETETPAADTEPTSTEETPSSTPTYPYAEQDQPGHVVEQRHGLLFYLICSAIGVFIILLAVIPIVLYVLKRRENAVVYESLNTGLLTAEDIELDDVGRDSFEISDDEPLRPVPELGASEQEREREREREEQE